MIGYCRRGRRLRNDAWRRRVQTYLYERLHLQLHSALGLRQRLPSAPARYSNPLSNLRRAIHCPVLNRWRSLGDRLDGRNERPVLPGTQVPRRELRSVDYFGTQGKP